MRTFPCSLSAEEVTAELVCWFVNQLESLEIVNRGDIGGTDRLSPSLWVAGVKSGS